MDWEQSVPFVHPTDTWQAAGGVIVYLSLSLYIYIYIAGRMLYWLCSKFVWPLCGSFHFVFAHVFPMCWHLHALHTNMSWTVQKYEFKLRVVVPFECLLEVAASATGIAFAVIWNTSLLRSANEKWDFPISSITRVASSFFKVPVRARTVSMASTAFVWRIWNSGEFVQIREVSWATCRKWVLQNWNYRGIKNVVSRTLSIPFPKICCLS